MSFDLNADPNDYPNHTPAHEETTITIAYLDEDGREQFNVIRTTRSAQRMRQTACRMKAAWETFYSMLGCTFLSAQISYENTDMLVGRRPRPRLSLIQGDAIGKKA